MDIENIIKENNVAFHDWLMRGSPEADNDLYESNIKLIKAYKEKYPNAKGYKWWNGIVDIPETIHNFEMDFVFDPTEDIIKELAQTDELEKDKILLKANGICLVWS